MLIVLAVLSTPLSLAGSRAPDVTATATLSDGQILAAVAAMDEANLDLASYARQRSKNTAVQELAQLLIDHHAQNRTAVADRAATERAPLETSAAASTTRASAGAALDTLRGQVETTFDRAFVDMMVDRHQAALVDVDSFATSTRSAGMATFLANTRAGLQLMLQHAVHEQQVLAATDPGA